MAELEKDWQAVKQDIDPLAVQRDVNRRIEQYTAWLRECQENKKLGLAIEHAANQGPYPYQWKVYTTDSLV
ncbi:MAG TPA: hypothetical protein VL991_13690, partial [Terracidiphilus sp.]|nr:hypothetical protein [Terracidiphilus sp.]